jgi:octaprenyl-diphosphate synthase
VQLARSPQYVIRSNRSELRDIQATIRGRLDAVATEMRRIVTADAPLVAPISAHLLAMQGKMLRPTLVLLASDVSDRSEPQATRVAAVVELIHLATLVHDDAVDHSVLRRGMATLNAAFSHQISVIAGDFVYARALTDLVDLGEIEPIEVLTRASAEMSIGELRQLATAAALAFSEDDYILLISAKTASLMSAACEVGALAGANEHRRALAEFGRALGMAFQIVDDMIDFTEEESTTGKPAGLDLREHKVTLPLIAALPDMPRGARADVESLFATSAPSDDQVARVTAIVRESGGLEYARARARSYATVAEAALDSIPDSAAVIALQQLVAYVLDRHA